MSRLSCDTRGKFALADLGYDANGNTTPKTDSTGTTNYSWDFENRLISAALPGSGGTVTFKYDRGVRVARVFRQCHCN